ncbi:MAG TPA: CsbD family protein [Gemmatimonadaceae bacterium]|nr:CsbD family protein [Gemmatimonadaceae bacterium]
MGEITDKVKGTTKEAAGKATGNDSMRREGQADQLKGDVKGAGNDVRDAIGDKVDDVRDKMHDKDGRDEA